MTRKVLLIDDLDEIVPLVSMCLRPLGVEVLHARNLGDALALGRSGEIGLVLLDLALGAEDGLQILPAVREAEGLEGLPVVVLTAHHSRKKQAFEAGAECFIERPFGAAELQGTVDLHLVR